MDWLKLLYLKSISTAQKRALVTLYGSVQAIFAASRDSLEHTQVLSAAGITSIIDASNSELISRLVENDAEFMNSSGVHYLGFTDLQYPQLLNQIQSPLLGLFVYGNIELLQRPQIAMVGSRNASPAGARTTLNFARELGNTGLTITSGMAAGIDSFAHQGALETSGSTIAVMGTGIDQIYPESNRSLYRQISDKGLVVTEFPPGTLPKRNHFPQRNRIISGLCLGTLVMEAGVRSGSLITARLAAEQGREVFAVPGSIHQPTSRGCHYLIRQGAKLVESIEDILDEIGHFFEQKSSVSQIKSETPVAQSEIPVYNLIDYAPISIDQLIENSGLTAEQVSSILVTLELKELIVEVNGCYQRLP